MSKFIILFYLYDDRSNPKINLSDSLIKSDEIIKELMSRPEIGLIQTGILTTHFEREYDKR